MFVTWLFILTSGLRNWFTWILGITASTYCHAVRRRDIRAFSPSDGSGNLNNYAWYCVDAIQTVWLISCLCEERITLQQQSHRDARGVASGCILTFARTPAAGELEIAAIYKRVLTSIDRGIPGRYGRLVWTPVSRGARGRPKFASPGPGIDRTWHWNCNGSTTAGWGCVGPPRSLRLPGSNKPKKSRPYLNRLSVFNKRDIMLAAGLITIGLYSYHWSIQLLSS